MALVSYFHEELDRFITFAEEAESHLVRSGWVRRDNPADAVTDAAEAEAVPEPVIPPPVGEDIVYDAPEPHEPEHEAETEPEVPAEQQ